MPRLAIAAAFVLASLISVSMPARGDELLSNGGFESGINPWTTTFGQLEAVSSPVHGGDHAARLSSSALQSHEVYRAVSVAPGHAYEMRGWALLWDQPPERVFLRVSWFDGGGSLVSHSDSSWLTIPLGEYQQMTTGALSAPLAAVSARIGVRVQASAPFTLYLDEISFQSAALPVVTPEPTAVPTAPPTAPATPTPRPTQQPSQPTTAPDAEPDVFDTLTNGGFEVARSDGTPYAWKEFGADVSLSQSAKIEGQQSLVVTSRSSSTKWVYQTVRVQGGAYYEATAYTWNSGAEETFLRVSWYSSLTGAGSALDSVDSTTVAARGSGFEQLTTGPVQAPEGAQTARIRLMLRPGSTTTVAAQFDAVTFGITDARPAEGSSTGHLGRSGGGANAAAASSIRSPYVAVGTDSGQAAQFEARTGFVNVKPVATPPPATVAAGSSYDWLAVLGVAVGGAAIVFAVASEWSKRKRETGGPDSEP